MQPQLHELPELPPGAALWRGAVTALVIVLPAGILNQVAVADDWTLVVLLTFPAVMLGAAAGGWAVRRLSPAAPLWMSAAAAAAAYVLVQGGGAVRRLVAGESVSPVQYVFLTFLMASCGMLGGLFARRTVARVGGNGDHGTGTGRSEHP